eukprot:GHVS01054652.1.p1 GENE.GHVS01054652.1~~GHVS01054652.1.p1  ORF type:complete len:424 (+),score=74.60 GHVS01054652.1:79-1350(+)
MTNVLSLPPSLGVPTNVPPPSSHMLELGEYLLQVKQDPSVRLDDSTLTELNSIMTALKLASKVVYREISKANTFNFESAASNSSSGVGRNGSSSSSNNNSPSSSSTTSTTSSYSPTTPREESAVMAALANRRFLDALIHRQVVAGIASQAEATFLAIPDCRHKSLVALINPMDGTKQIDVNVSTGSLFSIYRRVTTAGEDVQKRDFLQPGSEQICAGYVIYGSSTMLVCTIGHGVQGFTMDPSLGTFYLSHRNIRMPLGDDGRGGGGGANIYSVNAGKRKRFPEGVKEYLDICQDRSYPCRYIGSIVADFHRNMLKGGIFIYPPTFTDPNPSVSMVFQCFPLAFLAEQAGGRGSDGFTRILDIVPTKLDDRICFFGGSKFMVEMAEKCMARNKLRDGGWCFRKAEEGGTADKRWDHLPEASSS